jgi:hypothetical protein
MFLSNRWASLFPSRNSLKQTRRAARAVVERIEPRLLLTATPIVSGQTIAGTIGHSGQVDTYTFTANAGNSFDITVGDADATSGFHPYLQVLSPTGPRIINNGTPATKTSVDGIYTVPPTGAGTYTVLVQDYFGTGTGGYNIELGKAPSAQHADSNGDGGLLTSGQTKAGNISRFGDIDVFTFSAAAGNSFDITFGDANAASGLHPYLQVFNPTGTRVLNNGTPATSTSVEGIYTVPASNGGTYTAIVQDYFGNATGAYNVELAVAPATQKTDSNGDGGPIVNTQTKAGNINRFGDIDVFTFTATAGDQFDVTFGDASAASGLHPYLQIFNPAGARIINDGTPATNTSVSGIYHIPTGGTGTYTIVAQDYFGNSTGAYNMQLTGNIHPVGAQIVITPPAAQTAAATASASIKLGTFTATNAFSPYSVDVKWGDGTPDTIFSVTSPGTIPAKAHIFSKAGTDTVSEIITDAKSNKSNTATFKVTIGAALATISGRVFGDTNANGLVDKGELGLGLFTVFIDKNKNGVFDTGDVKTTTDVFGNWSFGNLAAGSYVVRVVQITGAAATKPTGGVLTINVTAGQTSAGNLFGEHGI